MNTSPTFNGNKSLSDKKTQKKGHQMGYLLRSVMNTEASSFKLKRITKKLFKKKTIRKARSTNTKLEERVYFPSVEMIFFYFLFLFFFLNIGEQRSPMQCI